MARCLGGARVTNALFWLTRRGVFQELAAVAQPAMAFAILAEWLGRVDTSVGLAVWLVNFVSCCPNCSTLFNCTIAVLILRRFDFWFSRGTCCCSPWRWAGSCCLRSARKASWGCSCRVCRPARCAWKALLGAAGT